MAGVRKGVSPERVKQIGAASEFLWFFISSVGQSIKGTGTINLDQTKNDAARVRKEVEDFATKADLDFF